MIPRTAFTLIALSAIALAACGSDDATSDAEDTLPAVGAAPAAADLDGRSFESTEVTGHEVVAGSTITLAFEDDRLSANAGCNSMNGGYTIDDGVLTVGAMASTMMACEDALMAQDTWLSEFLSSGPEIALDGATLTLTGDNAAIVLAEVEDAPLVGTTWNVTGTVANEGVSSVPAEPTASITINDDGTVSVETGCNSGSGPVEITDTTLTFGAIAVTMRACAEEAVDQLEQSVLTALQGEVTYEIDGDTMSIRSGEGPEAVGLEFTAAG
jgi:heat shock protein HslJ